MKSNSNINFSILVHNRIIFQIEYVQYCPYEFEVLCEHVVCKMRVFFTVTSLSIELTPKSRHDTDAFNVKMYVKMHLIMIC